MSETVPRLFVGGPWHGQVKPVPKRIRDYDHYYVPLPAEPVRFLVEAEYSAMHLESRAFTYEMRRMWFSTYYPSFVVMAPPDAHKDDVMAALIAAAGITPEGDKK